MQDLPEQPIEKSKDVRHNPPQAGSNQNGFWLMLALVTLVSFGLRIMPHAPNWTPILALATWSALRLSHYSYALLIPWGIMLATDWWLGFHQQMPTVYLSLLLIVAANARWFNYRTGWLAWLLRGVMGTVGFFIVTNFGVWIEGSLYARNLSGLLECYVMALPFYPASLQSTVAFLLVFYVCEQLIFVGSCYHLVVHSRYATVPPSAQTKK